MSSLSRRNFLSLGASTAGAAALAACSSGSTSTAKSPKPSSHRPATSRLGNPADAPFDHVVVLMMENRSFDHMLGWLPGADGKQSGLSYPGLDGKQHATWALGTDYQGCGYLDPKHQWEAARTQLNDG